jgi:hypothetical protein
MRKENAMIHPRSRYYILREGQPLAVEDPRAWARWFATADAERIVTKTHLGEVLVSTVFLAFDHNWRSGPALLFETMVFGGPLDGSQWRFGTREEAAAFHDELVRELTQHYEAV